MSEMKYFCDILLDGSGGVEEKKLGFVSIDRSARGDTKVVHDLENTPGFLDNMDPIIKVLSTNWL